MYYQNCVRFKTKFQFSRWSKSYKSNILIRIIGGISVNLTQNDLLTKYKSFIRPPWNYGDIFYDKPDNENFQNMTGKTQCKAFLARTDAIQGKAK